MMLHIMNMYDDELLSISHVFLRHPAIVFPLIRAIHKNTVSLFSLAAFKLLLMLAPGGL